MELTIVETVVRNRERRRCFLQARRERKTVEQVVSEETQRRLAQKLADPWIAPPAEPCSPRAGTPVHKRPDDGPVESGIPALRRELHEIGGTLSRIVEELIALRETLSPFPAPVDAERLRHESARADPGAGETAASGVSPDEVTSMIDHLVMA
jgi:hypothetical protein